MIMEEKRNSSDEIEEKMKENDDEIKAKYDEIYKFYDSDILTKHSLLELTDVTTIEKVWSLIKSDTMFEPETDHELILLGLYHQERGEEELTEKYYMTAVRNGSPKAMFRLGYYHGSIRKNHILMKKYYLMAIHCGYVYAIQNMAFHYESIKIYDLMKKYYMMAIENKEDTKSMIDLANYYKKVEKNYDLMKQYLLMAIEKGDCSAMNHMGKYYIDIEKNHDLAKKYLLMGIEKNDVDCMHTLGHFYHYTEINPELMKKYYLIAIEKGVVGSMLNLGLFYQINEPNPELMKKYYLMTLENPLAMLNLGIYYSNLAIPDYDNAVKYWTIACNKGHTKATTILGNYYKSRGLTDMMIKYYLMAIEDGCISATFELAVHYMNTRQNYPMMKKYFLTVIENKQEKCNSNHKDVDMKMLTDASLNHLTDYYSSVITPLVDKFHFFYTYKTLATIPTVNWSNLLLDQETIEFITNIDPIKTGLPPNHIIIVLHKTLKTKVDVMEMHFKYAPDKVYIHPGFQQAKADFYDQIV